MNTLETFQCLPLISNTMIIIYKYNAYCNSTNAKMLMSSICYQYIYQFLLNEAGFDSDYLRKSFPHKIILITESLLLPNLLCGWHSIYVTTVTQNGWANGWVKVGTCKVIITHT